MISKMILAATVAFCAVAASGCETTSMSAKSGPDSVVSAKQGGACSSKAHQRGACDDQVGCAYDSSTGQCNATH